MSHTNKFEVIEKQFFRCNREEKQQKYCLQVNKPLVWPVYAILCSYHIFELLTTMIKVLFMIYLLL